MHIHELTLPVEWKPAKKVAWRSGQGWNDYSRRSKHYHVLLLGDLIAGRLKRKFGEFLCGTQIKDKAIHEIVNLQLDMTPRQHEEITCPRCLERIQKLGSV